MRLFVLAVSAIAAGGCASAFERSAEEIQEQRQAIIDGILTTDSAADVAIDRNNCMAGAMPKIIRRVRLHDGGISANAADQCVAALMRIGKENALLVPYEKMVADGGGDRAAIANLPGLIGGAVVDQAADKVSIGNGRAIVLDAAIIFDAGFSAAYLKGETSSPGMPDLATLKSITEGCLDRKEDRLGLCYAAGYAHAVRALQGETVIAD